MDRDTLIAAIYAELVRQHQECGGAYLYHDFRDLGTIGVDGTLYVEKLADAIIAVDSSTTL